MSTTSNASNATRTSLLENVCNPDKRNRWEEFDKTYRGIVFGMARQAGLNHHDSEDLTQEVFRELVQSLSGFELREGDGCFRRYLFNLVRWRIGSMFEKKKREADRLLEGYVNQANPEADEDSISQVPGPVPGDGCSETDFREVITQAMLALSKDLPARHLQVLELYFLQEWPARRVAGALGLPAATVFTIAHRHKLRLVREVLCRL